MANSSSTNLNNYDSKESINYSKIHSIEDSKLTQKSLNTKDQKSINSEIKDPIKIIMEKQQIELNYSLIESKKHLNIVLNEIKNIVCKVKNFNQIGNNNSENYSHLKNVKFNQYNILQDIIRYGIDSLIVILKSYLENSNDNILCIYTYENNNFRIKHTIKGVENINCICVESSIIFIQHNNRFNYYPDYNKESIAIKEIEKDLKLEKFINMQFISYRNNNSSNRFFVSCKEKSCELQLYEIDVSTWKIYLRKNIQTSSLMKNENFIKNFIKISDTRLICYSYLHFHIFDIELNNEVNFNKIVSQQVNENQSCLILKICNFISNNYFAILFNENKKFIVAYYRISENKAFLESSKEVPDIINTEMKISLFSNNNNYLKDKNLYLYYFTNEISNGIKKTLRRLRILDLNSNTNKSQDGIKIVKDDFYYFHQFERALLFNNKSQEITFYN